MRLGDFILTSTEAILREWEQFAATLLPAANRMSRLRLRNHAGQLLQAIAKDLSEKQTPSEQSAKAKGQAPIDPTLPNTAAQVHALLRAQDGFDINQMAAEYRALRASVLRLWAAQAEFQSTDFEDMLRFNEAIDQALAESIGSFNTEVERSRNLLLGMLGHDMRNPLNAILLTAKLVTRMNTGAELSAVSARLLRSGSRMKALLDELVDFSRTQLGVGLQIRRVGCDLEAVCLDELELIRSAFPDAVIEWTASGDAAGDWDSNRIHQVLGNLLSNAIKYGSDAPIQVRLEGGRDAVVVSVTNQGVQIAPEYMSSLFEPLSRAGREDHEGLGLGLYIAQQVAVAHGGQIEAASSDTTTCFTVTLPRARSA